MNSYLIYLALTIWEITLGLLEVPEKLENEYQLDLQISEWPLDLQVSQSLLNHMWYHSKKREIVDWIRSEIE